MGSVTSHALKNKKYAFISFKLFLSQWCYKIQSIQGYNYVHVHHPKILQAIKVFLCSLEWVILALSGLQTY